jgi:triosephosphate isomerase (TIM)
MYTGIELKEPVFEIGFKSYIYGDAAVELACAADRISGEHGVPIIITPQCVDIYRIAKATRHILVFAQHADSLEPGKGAGSVLLEAVKAAGAVGVMLNHAERRQTLSEIRRTIQRADAVGLVTMVCADSPEEALAVAQFHPNILLTEPPDLIGTGRSVGTENRRFVADSVANIKRIDPQIVVFSGAGIKCGRDVGDIIRLGAGGTGSATGVLHASNPPAMIAEMVAALKAAWLETVSRPEQVAISRQEK